MRTGVSIRDLSLRADTQLLCPLKWGNIPDVSKSTHARCASYANVYITLQRCQKMSFLEGDVHVWGNVGLKVMRMWLNRTQNKKAPVAGSFLNQNGGGGGIRTLVTLYRPNGFRDRRIQPLCHPSAWGKNKAGSKACFGINWRRVRDLNPGDAFDAYTISNRAPSATRTTLR